jgi:hypothetical protein
VAKKKSTCTGFGEIRMKFQSSWQVMKVLLIKNSHKEVCGMETNFFHVYHYLRKPN